MKFADLVTVDLLNKTAEAHFFVAPNSNYLADHFPEMPMLPGLVMLEAAVRAASCWMTKNSKLTRFDLDVLESFYVVRRVLPNETVITRVKVSELAPEGEAGRFTASAHVGDEVAMRAKFHVVSASKQESAKKLG